MDSSAATGIEALRQVCIRDRLPGAVPYYAFRCSGPQRSLPTSCCSSAKLSFAILRRQLLGVKSNIPKQISPCEGVIAASSQSARSSVGPNMPIQCLESTSRCIHCDISASSTPAAPSIRVTSSHPRKGKLPQGIQIASIVDTKTKLSHIASSSGHAARASFTVQHLNTYEGRKRHAKACLVRRPTTAQSTTSTPAR